MIILHSGSPGSFLRAAMLSRLCKGLCMHKKEFAESMFNGRKAIDCDTINTEAIRKRYEQSYGTLEWFNSKKARSLAEGVFYASRYHSPDRYRLISKVLLQALEYDLDYVLGRVSKDARSMFNRSRRVCMEAHRANGFIRLSPVENANGRFMVGKADFQHDISDLVLRYFARRHRGWKIYLITGNRINANTEQTALTEQMTPTEQTACYLENSVVKTTSPANLPFDLPGDEFDLLWETYYESQYIEGRKNLALARKHLPQKYWSWVPEGNKLK
ncbi:DUF4130 domain-containing protein [Phosphitispora fastidiosa]|uniref:DUF4130 domain-containing protein n=1 Tax=Phosphitispora fastidiosa TaxID=2837202 RepID=UPI001E608198|nr:DUF4130 domain-containing protein [Phosphitispora fastidiosa]MBU7006840.1 putative DNA metabolism protein [Phosphitispora fastidiosa]